MLIAISKYLKPLAEVDAHRAEHLQFLKELYAQKKVLVSGRQNPPVGGVIVSPLNSKSEFEQILASDPFTQKGIAEYTIIEFSAALYDSCLNHLLSA